MCSCRVHGLGVERLGLAGSIFWCDPFSMSHGFGLGVLDGKLLHCFFLRKGVLKLFWPLVPLG